LEKKTSSGHLKILSGVGEQKSIWECLMFSRDNRPFSGGDDNISGNRRILSGDEQI
jgi:hypothetical protein